MRSQVLALVVALVTLFSHNAATAGETKVGGTIYSQWMVDMSEGADNANAFELTRAYIDVKSALTDYTSARVTADIRQADGFDGYTLVLKYAYLDWKPKFAQNVLMVRFGLQPTWYIETMNDLWGRRYLEKTASDLNSFLTSADIGAGAIVNFGEGGKYGLGAVNVWNGTSYTSIEEKNKQKDLSGFVSITPFSDNEDFQKSAIAAQYYHGTQNMEFTPLQNSSDYKKQLLSAGGLLAYRDIFDVGGDFNWLTMGQGLLVDDQKTTAYSGFGALYFGGFANEASPLRTLNIFGRVDMLDPDAETDNDGETYTIVGLECAPAKGVLASANYRKVTFDAPNTDADEFFFINAQVKF